MEFIDHAIVQVFKFSFNMYLFSNSVSVRRGSGDRYDDGHININEFNRLLPQPLALSVEAEYLVETGFVLPYDKIQSCVGQANS